MARIFACISSSLLSVAALAAPLTATTLDAAAPIVDLGYAQYQGYFNAQTNTTNFLSIRYAAPPSGNLRFQPPQPPVAQSGVQPATQNPNMCYQAPAGANTTAPVPPYGYNKRQVVTASEDWLFLNVFIPGTIPAEPVTTGGLPVLVWIHGGGYVQGNAATNNGAELVADSLNTMIVVVIQYRLGIFGFLSGNEVKAQGALNAGLLDQDFALQWVQGYIELFGGDNNHVTIWGASAGAGSILQHVVANGGNTQPPRFNAAMASSVFLPSQYRYNDRLPQAMYDRAVAMTGCASSSNTFTCLQSIQVETLQTANSNLAASAFHGSFVFVPVVDGTFIVERPSITLARGQVNGNALLGVNTQNEGHAFVDAGETLAIADYVSQLFPDMAYPQTQEVAYVYRDFGTAVEQAIAVMGDSIFICPTYYLVEAFAGRSWKGFFAIPPSYHGQDIAYYFYNPSSPPLYDNAQFTTAFSQSFMSLAKYYDVNTKFDADNITPQWDKYYEGRMEMLFNRTDAGAPEIMPITTNLSLVERCALWRTLAPMTAQ